MSYSKLFPLIGALLAIHMWLQGAELLVAWILLGTGCAFWWKGPRFFRAVLASEVVIGIGYYLLAHNSQQVHWLTQNSALPAYAWLAILGGFNLFSCCICVGIPYTIITRLQRMRSRAEKRQVGVALEKRQVGVALVTGQRITVRACRPTLQ